MRRCRAVIDASELDAEVVLRVEGESDPADSAVVAGVRCSACGTAGVLVAMYGPAADGADADVVAALADRNRRSDAADHHQL